MFWNVDGANEGPSVQQFSSAMVGRNITKIVHANLFTFLFIINWVERGSVM